MVLNEFTIVCWSLLIYSSVRALLFPANTVFQLIPSLSVPVELVAKDRRLFFDWGVQMNYNMPFNVTSFYNVPIWPGFNKREAFDAPSMDYTATELYAAFEQLLTRYDYHKTCLQRAMCELAHHPFESDEGHLFSALLSHLLTPSQHADMAEPAHLQGNPYALAEERGLRGQDCALVYSACDEDLLSLITRIDFV